MAKLFFKRRSQMADKRRKYHIVIDGERGAWIGSGQTLAIELPAGRHEATMRIDWNESRPLGIDVSPERHQLVEVSYRFTGWRPFVIGFLAALPVVLLPFAGFTSSSGGLVALCLQILVLSVFLLFGWGRWLCLEEIASLDPTAEPFRASPGQELKLSDLPLVQPLRYQFSIRWMMIGVAIVAALLWAGLNLEWLDKRTRFQIQADSHTKMELVFRELAERGIREASRLEKDRQNAEKFRQLAAGNRQTAARAAARADYHAAMKHKYEQAISQSWIFVDPDPPPPTWP